MKSTSKPNLGQRIMKFHEITIKLNESDFAYVNAVIASGEFSSASDFVAYLIRGHRNDTIETDQEVEMLREKLERARQGPFRTVTGEQLLEEIHERARKDGLLPPKEGT